MEHSYETHTTFPKLQYDNTLLLSRHHSGPSSLSLSLSGSGSGSRTGSIAPPKLTTESPSAYTPTTTPPIAVRQSQQLRHVDSLPQQCSNSPQLSSSGRYLQSHFALSPLERAARADSASLFDKFSTNNSKSDVPRTITTSLQQQQQEQSISRAPKIAEQPDRQQVFQKKTLPVPVRSNTESEKFNYDFSTGLRGSNAIGLNSVIERSDSRNTSESGDTPQLRVTEPTSVMLEPRRRFLTPGLFEKMMEDQDRMSSLTSDSTVGSPMSEALATPTDSEYSDMYNPAITNVSRSRSFHDPTSLGETSVWPRNLDVAHRNKSYNFESSQPPLMRRKRRAFSDKRLSPANQFLSGWTCQKAPEPDDEGQEVGAYVIGKQVGYGGFSVVKEAVTIKNGARVKRAVKIVRKKAHSQESENEKIQAEFEHEVSIWRYLSHPYILPLIEVYDSPFATFCFTQLTTGGTLFDLVKANRQGLPVYTVRKFSYQLASALRYLHEDVRILHRDIKLENCLIDKSIDPEGTLLLCDFGMSEQMPGSNDDDDSDSDNSSFRSDGQRPHKRHGPSDTSTSINGSLQYASPEMMIDPSPVLSPAADIWAYGVVLFALNTGSLPFNHTFQPKLQMMIAKGVWDVEIFRNARPFLENKEVGRMALEVVKGCLCKQVEKRWSIRMVLESEWLEALAVESP